VSRSLQVRANSSLVVLHSSRNPAVDNEWTSALLRHIEQLYRSASTSARSLATSRERVCESKVAGFSDDVSESELASLDGRSRYTLRILGFMCGLRWKGIVDGSKGAIIHVERGESPVMLLKYTDRIVCATCWTCMKGRIRLNRLNSSPETFTTKNMPYSDYQRMEMQK